MKINNKEVGLRIKDIRLSLGLSLEEFGNYFSPPADKSLVSRWERGISLPNNERLKKIAEISNKSTHFLTTGEKTLDDLSHSEVSVLLDDFSENEDTIHKLSKLANLESISRLSDDSKLEERPVYYLAAYTSLLKFLRLTDNTENKELTLKYIHTLFENLFLLFNNTEKDFDFEQNLSKIQVSLGVILSMAAKESLENYSELHNEDMNNATIKKSSNINSSEREELKKALSNLPFLYSDALEDIFEK